MFLIIIWLGGDLVVFFLSMSLLKRELPIAIRLDRAHIAEQIDRWVLVAFVLTIPVGLSLSYLVGYPIFDTPWLTLKLFFFGLIILMAIMILTGAAETTQMLKQIAAATGDVTQLEARLRRRILIMAPPALCIHLCILIIAFIALTRDRW